MRASWKREEQMVKLLLLLIIADLLIGCSQIDKKEKKSAIGASSRVKKTRIAKPMDFRPTRVNKETLFVDSTADYGLMGVEAIHLYAVDFDNDQDTDLIVLPSDMSHPMFFRFDFESKKFAQIKYNPFDQQLQSSFLIFSDMDRDGVMDILVGVMNQKSELTSQKLKVFQGNLVGDKVYYKEMANRIPLKPSPVSSISLVDYDLDGFLDIFIGNWFEKAKKGPKIIPDRLFRGAANFKFTDVSYLLNKEFTKNSQYKIYQNARPTFGVISCDTDQNGFPDFITTSSNGYNNKLWINLLDREKKYRNFIDYGKVSNLAADHEGNLKSRGGGDSLAAACADYNDDGIMDVFLGELSKKYDNASRDKSSILTGTVTTFPPTFRRTEYVNDVTAEVNWNQGDRRAIWFDYNLDGSLDLLVDNAGFPPHSRLVLFEQSKDHSFEEVSIKAGIDIVNPSGSVIIDLNSDGRLDIITGQTSIRSGSTKTRLYVFENQMKRKGRRSIRFYLDGVRSNSLGVGAMIIMETNYRVRRQWVDYAYGGFPSQNEKGILFGLDKGEKLRKVMVRWPIRNSFRPIYTSYHVSMHDISKLSFKKHLKITLCENEKTLVGVKACHK